MCVIMSVETTGKFGQTPAKFRDATVLHIPFWSQKCLARPELINRKTANFFTWLTAGLKLLFADGLIPGCVAQA